MKSAIWPALALALAASLPAACGDAAQTTAAGVENGTELTATNGRLALPAVSGNPAAVYFDITNDTGSEAVITGVSVQGARSAMLHHTMTMDGKSEMHELSQQPIASGETLKFEPGGMHVMAMEVADELRPGGTTQVTLNFEGGQALSFPAEILAAGDAR